MPQNCHILIVEDSESLATMYRQYLEQAGYAVDVVHDIETCQEFLSSSKTDIMLLDIMLPDGDGLDILQKVKQNDLPIAVIVMTAYGSIHNAVKAMRAGAYDFLLKPFHAEKLLMSVSSAHENLQVCTWRIKGENTNSNHDIPFLKGNSQVMRDVYHAIRGAACSKAPVFITGESGTGKELCAHAIHDMSARHDEPFIALNCASIPKDLMETEIFGHVRGAFTGAVSDREGAAEKAHGGTLFLDEVAEMSIEMQAKLLRFLQTNTFQKLGQSTLKTVDIRIMCATNRDPLTHIANGQFREDLYYRLHVIPVHMPLLNERGQDIIMLAQYFFQEIAQEENKTFKRIDKDVENLFMHYHWPGNVRELQNILRQGMVMHDGDTLKADMLPAYLQNSENNMHHHNRVDWLDSSSHKDKYYNRSFDQITPLEDIEKQAIKRAIDICDGNVAKAASYLRVSPSTLYRRMKRQAKKN